MHGGSPVDAGSTFRQGYGTGLATDPNGDPINGTPEQALADLHGAGCDLITITQYLRPSPRHLPVAR